MCNCTSKQSSKESGSKFAEKLLYKPAELFFGGVVEFDTDNCPECFMRGFCEMVAILVKSSRYN